MTFTIHQGDAIEKLRELPEASVHCCITSPPYYGLRDYGVDGQIGLEPTPEEFIARLVEVFREVRRVLRDDGTLWVNIGDSYNAHPGQRKVTDQPGEKQATSAGSIGAPSRNVATCKPKDLIGAPWMLAFALRSDGWYLRQDIIWHKPNPMPESVKDRCTKAHEYVFMLSKSPRYWYDSAAVAESAVAREAGEMDGGPQRLPAGDNANEGRNFRKQDETENRTYTGFNGRYFAGPAPFTRNRRSVWTLATQPTPEAHFATFPLELPELCMKAGCPEGGTVLDPFAGAGTTGLACLKNGRAFVGIELNGDYVTMAYARAMKYYPLLASSCQTQAFPACAD